MSIERTFTIIKPCAMSKGFMIPILSKIEEAGFTIKAMKLTSMSEAVAEQFYGEHKGREFYAPLMNFMTSGPILVALLEKENAIQDFRTLIGPTNPEEAKEGTVRALYGANTRENAVHGSDSIESANRECGIFFVEEDIV